MRFEEWATEDQRGRQDELLVASYDSMDEAVYARENARGAGQGYARRGGSSRLPPRQDDYLRANQPDGASERRRRGVPRNEDW
eukprot:scaffold650786_cov39-Prasinocladus_malaysianus.AAC.1